MLLGKLFKLRRSSTHTLNVCSNETGEGHPERPERLVAVLDGLRDPTRVPLEWRCAPLATIEDVLLVHTPRYVDSVRAALAPQGLWNIDPDTVLSPGSLQAALRAAGAVCAAVDAVVGRQAYRHRLRKQAQLVNAATFFRHAAASEIDRCDRARSAASWHLSR